MARTQRRAWTVSFLAAAVVGDLDPAVQLLDLGNLGAEEGLVPEQPVEGDGGLVGPALDEILV